jgi:hypothetical protein
MTTSSTRALSCISNRLFKERGVDGGMGCILTTIGPRDYTPTETGPYWTSYGVPI